MPALDRTVRQLGFEAKYNASATRLVRGGIEMMATADVRLQFGDELIVVGDAPSLERVAAELGNSAQELAVTNFAPLFLASCSELLSVHFPSPWLACRFRCVLVSREGRWFAPSCSPNNQPFKLQVLAVSSAGC